MLKNVMLFIKLLTVYSLSSAITSFVQIDQYVVDKDGKTCECYTLASQEETYDWKFEERTLIFHSFQHDVLQSKEQADKWVHSCSIVEPVCNFSW